MADHVVIGGVAARTAKALGPPRGLDCLGALDLGLREMLAATRLAAGESAKPVKSFNDYEHSFVHVDIKYLPQMPVEPSQCYLFVAIERVMRWALLSVYADQSGGSNVDFLERLHGAAPVKISELLTDDGSQFTDRLTSKQRDPAASITSMCAADHWVLSTGSARYATRRQTAGAFQRANQRIGKADPVHFFAAEMEVALSAHCELLLHWQCS